MFSKRASRAILNNNSPLLKGGKKGSRPPFHESLPPLPPLHPVPPLRSSLFSFPQAAHQMSCCAVLVLVLCVLAFDHGEPRRHPSPGHEHARETPPPKHKGGPEGSVRERVAREGAAPPTFAGSHESQDLVRARTRGYHQKTSVSENGFPIVFGQFHPQKSAKENLFFNDVARHMTFCINYS